MLSVLHIIPDLKPASGPTAFCVSLCDRLAAQGARVAIMHGGVAKEGQCRPQNEHVQLFTSWREIGRDTGRYDVVHIHALWAPMAHAGARFARRNGIPYVVSTHGMLAPWALKHKWLKKRVAWWLYQRCDLKKAAMFHATAACEIKWLRDLGFEQPCVLAPLGADLPRLVPAESLRRRDVKTVLFLGRIYPVKGLMNLVRAWARLKEVRGREEQPAGVARDSRLKINGVAWRLVVAGPDQAGHKAELLSEAKRLGLSCADASVDQLVSQSGSPPPVSDITFTGPVYGEEKCALYRMADLFVLPSFSENFGAVVVDALAYGIPVITTKGTPWADLLGPSSCERARTGGLHIGHFGSTGPLMNEVQPESADGPCGWWIDIGAEPLAQALQQAARMTDEERGSWGRRGQLLVESKYSWDAIANLVLEAYSNDVHAAGSQNAVCS